MQDSLASIWLELTGKCQLSCSHCYAASSPSGTHGTMTDEDWNRVIDDAARMGVGLVQFIGGEPSSSMPTLMALMLEALDAEDGDRVLEIGTGVVGLTSS